MDRLHEATYRWAQELGAVFDKPPEMSLAAWLIYAMVDDVHAAMFALHSAKGGD